MDTAPVDPFVERLAEVLTVAVLFAPFAFFGAACWLLWWVIRRGDQKRRAALAAQAQRQQDVRFWLATFNNASTPVERETARLMLFELGAWKKGES